MKIIYKITIALIIITIMYYVKIRFEADVICNKVYTKIPFKECLDIRMKSGKIYLNIIFYITLFFLLFSFIKIRANLIKKNQF